MNPKVSIIIPTYNRANLLSRAIKSVLNQTFKDFELIIVDDGSTDNTRQVVEGFQKRDPRIKYIWQENFGGPAKPINAGLKVAQGEYIAFIESDDEWLPEKLERQLEIFQNSKKEDLGFVGCNVLIVNEKTKTTKVYNILNYDNKILEKLLAGEFFSNFSTHMVKREVMNIIGLLDENLKLSADQDICLRIAKRYNFDFVSTPLIKYHVHEENISMKSSYNKQLTDWLYILRKHQGLYKRYPKIYSHVLRGLGALYILSGNCKQSRQYFLRSIAAYPLNFKSYRNLLLSFLGSKAYRALLSFKEKISQNSL